MRTGFDIIVDLILQIESSLFWVWNSENITIISYTKLYFSILIVCKSRNCLEIRPGTDRLFVFKCRRLGDRRSL